MDARLEEVSGCMMRGWKKSGSALRKWLLCPALIAMPGSFNLQLHFLSFTTSASPPRLHHLSSMSCLHETECCLMA
eukprot:1161275-Pelagomonas_calceolata.AAC.9